MRYLLFLIFVVFAVQVSYAQDTVKPARRNFDSSLFTPSTQPTRSDYLTSLEKVFEVLHKVPVVTSSFFAIDRIRQGANDNDSALLLIKERLLANERTINMRNLQMFRVLLMELDQNINEYQLLLKEYNDKLDSVKRDIMNLRKDTLIRCLFRDSALRLAFAPQLQQLRGKWKMTDSIMKGSTALIND